MSELNTTKVTDLEVSNQDKTITSLTISEMTGKDHKNVMRDIRDEIDKLEAAGISTELKFEFVAVQGFGAMKRDYFKLSKEGVLQIAARYDAVTRSKLIKRVTEQDVALTQMQEIVTVCMTKMKELESMVLESNKKQLELSNSVTEYMDAERVRLVKRNGQLRASKILNTGLEKIDFEYDPTGDTFNYRTAISELIKKCSENHPRNIKGYNDLYNTFKEKYEFDLWEESRIREITPLDLAERCRFKDTGKSCIQVLHEIAEELCK